MRYAGQNLQAVLETPLTDAAQPLLENTVKILNASLRRCRVLV
jgi:hypothetical protein